ncbi:carbonate dehydratase [Patescibacteria group bacterium]|nr:carbonate dehydratase [Patescibacteria group bacterium]
MIKLKILFENNANWVASKMEKDPEYFLKTAKDQLPHYLWVGCSDSRVPANEIVGLEPGELFVHRNVANLFPHTDFNCLSVLEFAIDILKIEHVIVCGHYNCGGVKAAMLDHQLGLVDNWLRNIRDVYAVNKQELEQINDDGERYNRLVELNVLQQVKNICHTTIVQEAWHRKQPLTVHGWVYDLETGKLRDLCINLSGIDDVDTIYRIKKL